MSELEKQPGEVDVESALAPAAEVNATEPVEPTLPQSKVNELIGRVKHSAYEKAKAELLGNQARQVVNPNPENLARDERTKPSADSAEMQNLIDERLQSFQQQQKQEAAQEMATREAERILSEMQVKMRDAKSRYSDYDDKLKAVNGFQSTPDIYHYANMVENGGDVLYDLANNPAKVATLKQLGDIDPQLALLEVRKLSDSIKTNMNPNVASTPAPLARVKTSTVGMDNGKMTSLDKLRDFKNKYRG